MHEAVLHRAHVQHCLSDGRKALQKAKDNPAPWAFANRDVLPGPSEAGADDAAAEAVQYRPSCLAEALVDALADTVSKLTALPTMASRHLVVTRVHRCVGPCGSASPSHAAHLSVNALHSELLREFGDNVLHAAKAWASGSQVRALSPPPSPPPLLLPSPPMARYADSAVQGWDVLFGAVNSAHYVAMVLTDWADDVRAPRCQRCSQAADARHRQSLPSWQSTLPMLRPRSSCGRVCPGAPRSWRPPRRLRSRMPCEACCAGW